MRPAPQPTSGSLTEGTMSATGGKRTHCLAESGDDKGLTRQRRRDAMATLADRRVEREPKIDVLSGTPRANPIDRWIFVSMAVWFIVVTLTGFVPDSLAKIAAVQAGDRPPFPLVLHLHAVLMASFLLLVLAQTTLMATG